FEFGANREPQFVFGIGGSVGSGGGDATVSAGSGGAPQFVSSANAAAAADRNAFSKRLRLE
ncbi:hypothetical protein HDU98_005174, partial [Podochytrium sp. JEL0797]